MHINITVPGRITTQSINNLQYADARADHTVKILGFRTIGDLIDAINESDEFKQFNLKGLGLVHVTG